MSDKKNLHDYSYNNDKIFFTPGDVVRIKHDIGPRPKMLVKSKEQKHIKQDNASHFIGIRCFWFSNDAILQEAVFSTKDLELVTEPVS